MRKIDKNFFAEFGRHKTMQIEITRKHVCDEECQFAHFLQFRTGPNPKWNSETKTCNLSGRQQSCSPHILSWLSDKSEFNLSDPTKIVIPAQTAKIEFSYPFSGTHTFDFKADTASGFTLEHLIDSICQKYKAMYDEENSVTVVSTVDERVKRGGLLNREPTAGPYGVWGHDIGDLYLEGIDYDPETGTVRLSIGS